jgi:hypothetical protein
MGGYLVDVGKAELFNGCRLQGSTVYGRMHSNIRYSIHKNYAVSGHLLSIAIYLTATFSVTIPVPLRFHCTNQRRGSAARKKKVGRRLPLYKNVTNLINKIWQQ